MEKINLMNIKARNVYVRLNEQASRYYTNLVKKSGTLLDQRTNAGLYRLSKRQKISVVFMKRLAHVLDKPLKWFIDQIELITSVKNTNVGIKNPKIPFNFGTVEGARFIAAVMGDGEINNQLQVRYNNQDKRLINLILHSAKEIFGDIDYKIYLREDNTFQLHFPKITGLIVTELGLKPGYKSETNYGIPPYIFSKNKKIKSAFVRQFFNDEGNVRLKDRRLQVKQTVKVNVSKEVCKQYKEKYCHRVLIGLQLLLRDLGITSNITLGALRKNKADWELSFYGKENLEIFRDKIGFDSLQKQKNIETAIKSYKFPSAPRNKRIEFALEKFRIVQKRNGFVTKHFLAKECKRSKKTATYYLVDLKKKSMISESERPRNNKGYFMPRKYVLL